MLPRILNGGVESGFRKVKPEEYRPRLLHFQLQTNKKMVIQEVELSLESLDSGDVYIIDMGLQLYQWNGKTSNKEERFAVCSAFTYCFKSTVKIIPFE